MRADRGSDRGNGSDSERVRAVLQQVRGERVLDVGCAGHTIEPGRNRWLHGRIVAQHPLAVGIDHDVANLMELRRRGLRRMIVGDAEALPVGSRFDTIVAGELLEHLSNPGGFLADVRDHLSDGGRLIVTTPYPFSLFTWLYAMTKFPRTCQNPDHVTWFCPETLTKLAQRAGLRVAHWELVEDYDPEKPAPKYRWFARFMRGPGRVLPKRLRCNAILFVFEADER